MSKAPFRAVSVNDPVGQRQILTVGLVHGPKVVIEFPFDSFPMSPKRFIEEVGEDSLRDLCGYLAIPDQPVIITVSIALQTIDFLNEED